MRTWRYGVAVSPVERGARRELRPTKPCARRTLRRGRRRSSGVAIGCDAGGPMRAVLEVVGVRNIVAKSHGSSNPYNLVRATLDALSKLKTPSEIAAKRGLSVEKLFEA